jgi:hypothetical protein
VPALIGKREYLHDHNSLLHDVANSSRNKVQQYIDASLSAGLYLHCGLPYRLDASSHEVNVHLGGISRPESVEAVEPSQA